MFLTILNKIFAVLFSITTAISGVIYSPVIQQYSVFGPKAFEVTLDETTKELCDIVKENSYLDLENLVTTLPDLNGPMRLIDTVFSLDTESFKETMYSLRDEFYAKGDKTTGRLFYLTGAFVSGFQKCDITLEKNEEDVYEFVLNVGYADGSTEKIWSGAFYNPETGLFYGRDDKGMFEIGFNFDINEMVIYATVNSWMRGFGFCFEYDLFTYLTPLYFYNTRRFKFNYDGREWMIQAWKGMYVISNGAEVGVYNRPKSSVGTFYNCADDEDMLNMSFGLYHGDDLLFTRKEESHWWINGFQLSKDLYSADELTLKFTIEMKDEEMLSAFLKSVDSELHRDVTYTVDGLKVSLVW